MSRDLPGVGSLLSVGGQAAAIEEGILELEAGGMEARQAQAADWEALRQLRLQALADAPDAFASTLEAEVALPTEVWQQRAQSGPTSANFIAREGGIDVGLIAVFAEPNAPGCIHLMSMWVDPATGAEGWPAPSSTRPYAGRPNAKPAR